MLAASVKSWTNLLEGTHTGSRSGKSLLYERCSIRR